ncbi:MAG TPA: mannosyltransferase family protein [Candidatus Limnocylindrales bacterium]|nr:mannosyltransferase family protein [Candidatus Limnocylindrales bacterium]
MTGALRRPRRWLDGPVGPALVEAVGLFLALRIGLTLMGLFVAVDAEPPGPCHFELAFNGWRTLPALDDGPVSFPFLGVWQRWDACWYEKIATYGYEPAENSVAFFPLYPLVITVASLLTLGDLVLAGIVVSAVAYVAGVTGLLVLVGEDFGARLARRTALYLSLFPAAFFLLAPFTESLFLALSIWTLIAARRWAWGPAALLGLLAALTRPQGLLLVAPVAWEAWRAWRDPAADGHAPGPMTEPADGAPAARATPVEPRGWRRRAGALVASGAPIVGLALYAGIAQIVAGETPFEAQDLWGGRSFYPPWEVVEASARWIVERGDAMQLLNLVSLLGAAALLAAGVGRLPLSYLLYAVPQLLLVGSRIQPTPLTSTTRYVLVLFPIFVVLAWLTARRPWRTAWLVGSTLFLGLLTYRFLIGDFVA